MAIGTWGVLLMTVMGLVATPREALAQLGALVSPGRLSRAHASLEGINSCLQCHTAGRGVSAQKCLTCHKPIAERIARKRGVHRAVTTDCVTCHVEHAGVDAELRPFNTQRFNHATDAAFPLDGLHASLATNCAACHKTRSFLAASPSCSSCHTDAHKGTLGPRCETCHTTAVRFSDSRTRFDHGRTAFPLTGAHTSVTCSACHTKGATTYKVASTSCASCHNDPHRAQFGGSCASCHVTQSWKTTKVDHSRTAFPLRGQHLSVQCVSCHAKPATQVKPKADTCAACHTDPHRGVFKQDCKSCHDESSFKKAGPSGFDHSSTRFPLVDTHAGLTCAACHTSRAPVSIVPPGTPSRGAGARGAAPPGRPPVSADFSGLRTDCVSCHTDVHRAELGTSCETCHTARSFQVTGFRHARVRAFFDGQHATLRCAQCHTSTYGTAPASAPAQSQGTVITGAGRSSSQPAVLRVGFAKTSDSCASCHMDVHLGQVGTRCETCHTVATPRFAVRTFQHSTTKFPLTGKHPTVACESCHTVATQNFPAGHGTARRLTGMGTACATCHQDPHKGELGASCERCHSTDTFAFSGKWYVHSSRQLSRTFFVGRHVTACVACHKRGRDAVGARPTLATYVIPTTCTSCHTDIHRGALGPRCESCHKP
jgi:class III cytochrome C family protein